jgi:hypothetical protein
MQKIINAAPMVVNYGTEDISTVTPVRVPESRPQHLPKFWLYTERGTFEPTPVSGAEFATMYGSKSLDERSPYFNHSSVFAKSQISEGATIMVQRLKPANMGPKSSAVIWLDVLSTKIDDYSRNADGSIALDNLGQPIVVGQIQGYKVKFVKTIATGTFGAKTETTGDQTDGTTISQRYPIFEQEVSTEGAWGNGVGFSLSAPTQATFGSMPVSMMSQGKAYPYVFKYYERPDIYTSAILTRTILGDLSKMVTFKADVVDPSTDQLLDVNETLVSSYQNLEDTRYPIVLGPIGRFYAYQDKIATLTQLFHASEINYINSKYDFTQSPEDAQLFNFVSGVTSYGYKYHSYIFVDDVNSIRMSESNIHYLEGGSDGTMDDTTHAGLVSQDVLRYLDSTDVLMDDALNTESVIYDTGFPLQTKKDLCAFVAVRKDTRVRLSSFDAVAQTVLDLSQELSIGTSLRTYARMFPESDYFGTNTIRVSIFSGSGKIRNSQWSKRVPMTYDVALKCAQYMGAGNGVFKSSKRFDRDPGNEVTSMFDLKNTWVPGTTRNKFWEIGLNWVGRSSRSTFFYPAFKTICDNDTSVLNSMLVVDIIGEINKITNMAWRKFTGNVSLTPAQLSDNVNQFIRNEAKDKFDGLVVVEPKAQFTQTDINNGYSWTVPVKIGANNMQTVMTTYVQAYRMSDLVTQ